VAVLRGIVRWARICPSTLIDSPSRIRQVTSPGPWTFYQYRYGFSHVVCDADGRIIASSVMAKDGLVSADATPRVGIASSLGNAPKIAKSAVEACEERAAIILADWNPSRRSPRPAHCGHRELSISTRRVGSA